MTRFPNPFAAVTQVIGRAFAILGDRDGAGSHGTFAAAVPRSKTRRSPRAPTPRTHDASAPGSSDRTTHATPRE